jgi:hypothetical protein
MKKIRIALCLSLLAALALPACSFALTVGNPYKTGSLIIFPLIDVSDDTDTVVTISNSFYEDVNIACRFRSVSAEVGGVAFALVPYETVWFSLKTGEGSMSAPFTLAEKGELKCWAVSPPGTEQISWNYLQGLAEITDTQGHTWSYSSWNFAANQPRGESVGQPGVISLTGLPGGYDAMPKYLSFNISGTVAEAEVTLALGKQDLRQDRQSIYSKAKFNYSRGGTSSQQCMTDGVRAPIKIKKTVLGSFKVQGIASTVCDVQFNVPLKTTQDSPLLGVIEATNKKKAVFGIMPIGMGADGSGFVLWDADGQVVETIAR